MNVAHPQAISKVHRYDDVREYLHLLLYMLDFEDLRISQSLKEFHACDKLSLARSLWVTHQHDLKAVQLICNLCLDFKLKDISLWEQLLTRLLQSREIDYLIRVFEDIEAVSLLAPLPIMATIRDGLLHALIDVLASSDQDNTRITNEIRLMALIHRLPGLIDETSVIRILNHAQETLSA
ncbi:rough deal protein C-terminal region-domain-containing protein [Syncephalis fuscata]|nr:rough deal protein C-terminal region-domain-containing protein [Syncephalis fuscata]